MDLKWLRAFLRLAACLALVGRTGRAGLGGGLSRRNKYRRVAAPAPNARGRRSRPSRPRRLRRCGWESHLVDDSGGRYLDSAGQFVYDVDQE